MIPDNLVQCIIADNESTASVGHHHHIFTRLHPLESNHRGTSSEKKKKKPYVRIKQEKPSQDLL